MLAEAGEVNMAEDHDLVLIYLERGAENVSRLLMITAGHLVEGRDHSTRRITQTISVRILAHPSEESGDGFSGRLFAIQAICVRRPGLLPLDQLIGNQGCKVIRRAVRSPTLHAVRLLPVVRSANRGFTPPIARLLTGRDRDSRLP